MGLFTESFSSDPDLKARLGTHSNSRFYDLWSVKHNCSFWMQKYEYFLRWVANTLKGQCLNESENWSNLSLGLLLHFLLLLSLFLWLSFFLWLSLLSQCNRHVATQIFLQQPLLPKTNLLHVAQWLIITIQKWCSNKGHLQLEVLTM